MKLFQFQKLEFFSSDRNVYFDFSQFIVAVAMGMGITRLEDGGGRCNYCGRTFSGLRNAKRHFSTVHLQENSPCTCPVCNKGFIRRELMKDHLRRKHNMYKDMYKDLVPKAGQK